MTTLLAKFSQWAVSAVTTPVRYGVLLVCILSLVGCSEAKDVADDKHPGEQTYIRYCFSCHASGVAGAPKVGDVEAWAPRIAKGLNTLVVTSMAGVPPGMPAKGLCNSCTVQEMADAIQYRIDFSQGE